MSRHGGLVSACLAAALYVTGSVLAFTAPPLVAARTAVDAGPDHGRVAERASMATSAPGSRDKKGFSWLGQSFNGPAVATMGKVTLHPSLAVPHLSVPDIGHLDFEALRALGCKGVVFDKDNTLTAPYADDLHPLVEEGLRRCKQAFEGRVCIMSNSAGTRDDPGHLDAMRIENSLGIPVIRHDDKKPGGVEDVLAFFSGIKADGEQVRLDQLCFVGDRLLTDVVFGNLHGMLTVHVKPLTVEGDNGPATVFRFVEKQVYLGLVNGACSIKPREHRLFPGGPGLLYRGESSEQWGKYLKEGGLEESPAATELVADAPSGSQ